MWLKQDEGRVTGEESRELTGRFCVVTLPTVLLGVRWSHRRALRWDLCDLT